MVGWRASGLSAATYADRRGYSAASLLRWSKRGAGAEPEAPRFVRVEVVPSSSVGGAELVVEVGDARVRVARRFDAALLRAVVDALSGTAG